MKNRVFVSHPFSDNPVLRRKQVDIICKKLKDEGFLPVSPLHMFNFFEREDDDFRDDILAICYDLISMCDKCYFYKYPENISEGQHEEYQFAMNLADAVELNPHEFARIKRPPDECLQMETEVL